MALRKQGLSRRQIQLELGITKGQVDNILYRHETLAILNGGEYVGGPKSGPRKRPSAPVTVTDNVILSVEVSFEPPPGKINVWNIKPMQCRFLDEDGYFCGEPTASALRSYCDCHHKLSWVKTRRQTENAS